MSSRTFRAGCGREAPGPSDLSELAYTELAFPECEGCPHRLDPKGGPSFCRWLANDRQGPFAALASWTPDGSEP